MYDIMDLTEELVSDLVKHVTGSHQTTFHTQVSNVYHRRLNPLTEVARRSLRNQLVRSTLSAYCRLLIQSRAKPWKRIEIIPALEEGGAAVFSMSIFG